MRTTIAAAALAALAAAVPAAHADDPISHCGLDLRQDVEGQTHQGIAYGYAVHAEGGDVALRCYVTVNGVAAPSGDTGWGAYGFGHAVTYGPISYEAGNGDDVNLCTEVSTAHGRTTSCADMRTVQLPPQEALDALADIVAIPCDLLAEIGRAGFNLLGLVSIDQQGDVYLGTTKLWDC